jgi:hypothetical protein
MIAERNDSGLAVGPGLTDQVLEQVTVTQVNSVKDSDGEDGVLPWSGVGQLLAKGHAGIVPWQAILGQAILGQAILGPAILARAIQTYCKALPRNRKAEPFWNTADFAARSSLDNRGAS